MLRLDSYVGMAALICDNYLIISQRWRLDVYLLSQDTQYPIKLLQSKHINDKYSNCNENDNDNDENSSSSAGPHYVDSSICLLSTNNTNYNDNHNDNINLLLFGPSIFSQSFCKVCLAITHNKNKNKNKNKTKNKNDSISIDGYNIDW